FTDDVDRLVKVEFETNTCPGPKARRPMPFTAVPLETVAAGTTMSSKVYTFWPPTPIACTTALVGSLTRTLDIAPPELKLITSVVCPLGAVMMVPVGDEPAPTRVRFLLMASDASL